MAELRRKAKPKPISAKDRLKLSLAEDLGLLERVRRDGWGSLSAKECGRLGGVVSRALRAERAEAAREKALGNAGRA